MCFAIHAISVGTPPHFGELSESWYMDNVLEKCLFPWQGKGLGFGAIADFVHSIKIVNGAGEVVEYNATHPLFNQAR